VLSDTEIAAIWKALPDDAYGQVVRLLMLTGCRRAEIAGMRWTEFDFDGGTWTLPAVRSKNGKAHTLPLTPTMMEIIDSIPHREGVDLLFGRKHGFTGWSIGKRDLDEKLGLSAWVHHDIRRTVATRMNDIGIQPHIVEQILNHQSGHKRGVAGTYNRSVYAKEVRAAMALWSDHIRSLIDGDEHKVVAFERPAAVSRP
jgi:integrase